MLNNQNPSGYIAGGKAGATNTANPIQVEPPLVLQPNVGNILTSVANGLFPIEAAYQYKTLTTNQQSHFVASFMQMMVQDSSLRKAQDEVPLKYMRQAKENHRKNEIRIEDSMKKSP